MDNSRELETGIYYNGLMRYDGGKSLLEAIAVLINIQTDELGQIIREGINEGAFGKKYRGIKA